MLYNGKFVFLLILIIIFQKVDGQNLKYIHINYPQIPTFLGYVENEIIIEVEKSLVDQMDKIQGEIIGRCGISEIDNIAEIYDATKIVQKYPNAKQKTYDNKVIDLRKYFKLTFRNSINIEVVVNDFSNLTSIISAEPIGIHSLLAQYPNDGFFSDQWHLDQTMDHDVDAPEAWDSSTGDSDVLVAMLDSGVRYYHKDLGGINANSANRHLSRGNMWINYDELNGTPSSDDDSNGYIDDWIGWDFVNGITFNSTYRQVAGEDYQGEDNDPCDFNGHGTHCAGNISAMNNNGYATCATSGGWGNGSLQLYGNGVKTMALRIGYSIDYYYLGRFYQGEVGIVRMDFIADALIYAADNGARIASCSWGSSNSGGLGSAIDYFLASGGLIFKAAGNDNADNPDYMANRSDVNIIDVASTDSSDIKSLFSNYGNWIDISAPGTNIYSLAHVHSDSLNDYVGYMSGTSMATPIAASVAALIWSANNALTADQVRTLLFNNVDDIESINPTYSGQLGVGRVNAYNVMQDPSLPVTLTSFIALDTEGGINLNWTTESEIENLGFIIERKFEEEYDWQIISDYTINENLKGQGNSSSKTNYSFLDENVETDKVYEYQLADVSYTGVKTYLKTVKIDFSNNNLPKNFTLTNAYPNPFNPTTTIKYGLVKESEVKITIFDVSGRKIKLLVNSKKQAGWHEMPWNGFNDQNIQVSSGMYLYKMTAGNYTEIKKILLIR